MPRPYKALGYPVIPIIYLLLSTGFCVSLLIYKSGYSFRGLLIVLLGIPLYYVARRSFTRATPVEAE